MIAFRERRAPPERSAFGPPPGPGFLDPDHELLVMTARDALAELAARLEGEVGSGGAGEGLSAALDIAETVLRGELLLGGGARLPALLPALAYLVASPIAGRDQALELCREAALPSELAPDPEG